MKKATAFLWLFMLMILLKKPIAFSVLDYVLIAIAGFQSMVFLDIIPKPQQAVEYTNKVLSEDADPWERAQAIRTEMVEAKEHQYIDDYNTFDLFTIILAGIFIYLNIDYWMSVPDLQFTSLT